jgi:hypothetical protein
MKRAFVVLTVDGEDHDHPLFNNEDGTPKEFVSPGEVITYLHDHNRDVKNRIKDDELFKGSFIVAEVYTF